MKRELLFPSTFDNATKIVQMNAVEIVSEFRS